MPKESLTYPHFICIGPAKTATTWLADHLKLQLDMWFPPVQEISYPFLGFSHFEGTDQLKMKYDWWSITKRCMRNKSLLSGKDRQFYDLATRLAKTDPKGEDFSGYDQIFHIARGKITGDISPIYGSFSEEEIETLEANVNCRTVFMFARDPVARFWSHFRMIALYKKYGDVDYESMEIVQKFFNDPVRSKQFNLSQIYDKWHKVFGPERFSVFYFDDIIDKPQETLVQIISHVGGNPKARIPFVPPSINRNKSSSKLEFSREVEHLVVKHFQPELEACAITFGGKGEKWLKHWSK